MPLHATAIAPLRDYAARREQHAGTASGNEAFFRTDRADIDLIRVRAFDVATFVAHGAAQLGIVGSDVLAEFDYSELYAPVDLKIGHCRISVAEPAGMAATDEQPLAADEEVLAFLWRKLAPPWSEQMSSPVD